MYTCQHTTTSCPYRTRFRPCSAVFNADLCRQLVGIDPLAAHANTAIEGLSVHFGPLVGGTIAIIGGGTIPTIVSDEYG